MEGGGEAGNVGEAFDAETAESVTGVFKDDTDEKDFALCLLASMGGCKGPGDRGEGFESGGEVEFGLFAEATGIPKDEEGV